MKNAPEFAKDQSSRWMHDLRHEASLERQRIQNAKYTFILLSMIMAGVLIVDYTMGRAMFDYIAPKIGGSALSAPILALIFPITVVALHLLIADDGGRKIEYRLKRLAGVGIIVFLLGASALIASIMSDGTDGIGGSAPILTGGSPGTGENELSPITSVFKALVAPLPPLMFFFAMGFGLILTYYVGHQLLKKIEDHFETFFGASDRWREIHELVDLFDKIRKAFDKAAASKRHLIRKKPRDPDHRFSRIVSAAVHEELRQLRKALHYFPATIEPLDVVTAELSRKSSFPSQIETRQQGQQIIADIKDAMRPYAIMGALGSIPPKKDQGV